jgi:outer membrane usher protein FimD/PapC
MTKTELKKYSTIELETILKRVNEMLLIPIINEFNLNNQELKEMQKELNKELSKRKIQVTQIKQLQKISDYINEKYNLDTYINENTFSIWITNVWNKDLSDSIDIEISKEQIKQFSKELNNTKK